jgi:hypothetical protein
MAALRCSASNSAWERRSGLVVASNAQLAARQDRDLAASNKASGEDGVEVTE